MKEKCLNQECNNPSFERGICKECLRIVNRLVQKSAVTEAWLVETGKILPRGPSKASWFLPEGQEEPLNLPEAEEELLENLRTLTKEKPWSGYAQDLKTQINYPKSLQSLSIYLGRLSQRFPLGIQKLQRSSEKRGGWLIQGPL